MGVEERTVLDSEAHLGTRDADGWIDLEFQAVVPGSLRSRCFR